MSVNRLKEDFKKLTAHQRQTVIDKMAVDTFMEQLRTVHSIDSLEFTVNNLTIGDLLSLHADACAEETLTGDPK